MTPEPTKAYVGDSVVLSVAAFTSNGAQPKYRWKKGDVVLEGQVTNEMTIYALKLSDAGKYKVEIESDDGNPLTRESIIETQEIFLDVVAAPVTDVPPSLLTVRGSTSLTKGSRGYLSVAADGYPKPSLQWFKDGKSLAGKVDPYLIFNGATKEEEGIYHLEASNSAGVTRSEYFMVLVDQPAVLPQVVNSSLLTHRLALNSQLSLNADVAAYPTARFQWFKDGVAIAGETKSRLMRTGLTLNSAGIYRLTASNSAGSVDTQFAVTVVDSIQIVTGLENSMIAAGANATLRAVFSGEVDKVEWFKDGVLIPTATTATLNITAAAVSASGLYRVRATNISGSVESMATLTVIAAPVITTALPVQTSANELSPVILTVEATGTALTYQWFKNNTLIAGANMNRLTIGPATYLDEASFRVEVSNLGGRVMSQGNVNVSLVTDGAQIYARDCASCHGALPNSQRLNRTVNQITTAILTVPAMQGRLQKDGLVRLSPSQLSNLEAALKVNPPVITSVAPTDIKIYETKPATFTVTATGSQLTYQWLKDNAPIAGATSAIYTIPSVKQSDQGFYSVVVRNSGGATTSGSTYLYALGIPVVTTNLADTSIDEGGTLDFFVSNVTSDDFTWTWHHDSTLLRSGGMSEFVQMRLSLANLQLNQAGTYKLTVTNPAGSFVKTAKVTVVRVPLVLVTPLPAKIVSHCSEAINLSPVLSGTNAFTAYEWTRTTSLSTTTYAGAVYPISNGDCLSGKFTLVVQSGTQTVTTSTEVVRSYFKTVNGVTSFAPNTSTVIPTPDVTVSELKSIVADVSVSVYADNDDCIFVIHGYNPPKMAITKCNGLNIRVVDAPYRYITDGTNIMYVYIDSEGAKVQKFSHPNIDHATVRRVALSHFADSRAGYSYTINPTPKVTEFVGSDGPTLVDIGGPLSYCSKDKFRVYCEQTALPLVPSQAKLIGNHIADSTKVYFLSNPPTLLPNLVGANLVADGSHAWDLVNVYFNNSQILGALPSSFKPLNSLNENVRTLFSKDANRAYFKNIPVPGVNAASFNAKTYNSVVVNGQPAYEAEDAVAKYQCFYNTDTCTRTLK